MYFIIIVGNEIAFGLWPNCERNPGNAAYDYQLGMLPVYKDDHVLACSAR